MKIRASHFLSTEQISSTDDIEKLCNLASQLEIVSSRKKITRILEGAVLANLFFEPSTRTRISFGTAFNLLGGSVRETSGFDSSSITKGESIEDTSRIISGYVDAVVIRHPEIIAITQFANASKVPVINAGNGTAEHPTQALLDVYTILKEYNLDFEKIRKLSICIVGDLKHGRTVHSLSKLLSLFGGITFVLISPSELKMPSHIVDLLKSRENFVIESEFLDNALGEADIVYVTRIQEERFALREDFLKFNGIYSINRNTYDKFCKKEPIIMHPLPRDSRLSSPEIDNDLNHHPKLRIFMQSDNGIPIRMALFCFIFGVEKEVLDSLEDAKWQRLMYI